MCVLVKPDKIKFLLDINIPPNNGLWNLLLHSISPAFQLLARCRCFEKISSFAGLAPLHFELHSNGYLITISNAMCIYSYILITILDFDNEGNGNISVIFTIAGLVAEIYVGVELSVRMTSQLSQFVCSCDMLVVAATAAAGVYGAPNRMKNILKYMGSVASVDKSVGAHFSLATERRLCVTFLVILFFFSALIISDFSFYVVQAENLDRQCNIALLYTLTSITAMWDMVTNYIGFYLLWLVLVVLELQFAFTAFSVHARFQAVNDALAHVAMQISVPANGNPRLTVPPGEAIKRLANLHSLLCSVVHGLCNSYGVPLIVFIISTLLHLIETPYFLVMEIILSSVYRLNFLMLLFIWCITHVLRIFLVVEPCHYTICEGKRTEEIVCRMLTSTASSSKLISRLELFSRQLMLQSVSYTPMGMCTLDRPLVATIFGAVTTYLVILIQFQSNEK